MKWISTQKKDSEICIAIVSEGDIGSERGGSFNFHNEGKLIFKMDGFLDLEIGDESARHRASERDGFGKLVSPLSKSKSKQCNSAAEGNYEVERVIDMRGFATVALRRA